MLQEVRQPTDRPPRLAPGRRSLEARPATLTPANAETRRLCFTLNHYTTP